MTVTSTKFIFPGQRSFYKGKVRDVYNIEDKILLMIATDRISAFDVVLPAGIPYKGQVLNQIAAHFLDKTADIVPNWKIDTPDPMVTAGLLCEPFRVEMVVRGYLCGHAWREYKSGKRSICGVSMPEGIKENQAFPAPIITPSTKAEEGHDEDISREEIIGKGIVAEQDYSKLEEYSLKLFERGTRMAAEQGLILVDTKYEFGKAGDKIYLIDEIHTPDSSRYFYADGYVKKLQQNLPQKQLSKEFVREWLMAKEFQGKPGQQLPQMNEDIVQQISNRYIELFEKITGEAFLKTTDTDVLQRIENNCRLFLEKQH